MYCGVTQEKELLCFHREAFSTYTVNRNICRSSVKGKTLSADNYNWSHKPTVVSICNFINNLGNNGYTNVPQCYTICTLPILLLALLIPCTNEPFLSSRPNSVSAMSFINPHTLLSCYQHWNLVTHPLYNIAIMYTKE